ncbi:hypothetical protein [Thalassobellus citreus]
MKKETIIVTDNPEADYNSNHDLLNALDEIVINKTITKTNETS